MIAMNEDTEMKLKDFTGAKVLDAVDFLVEKTVNYRDETEDCQVCRFRLIWGVYVAVKTPGRWHIQKHDEQIGT